MPKDLTEEDIKRFADSKTIFNRGESYYRNNKIKFMDVAVAGEEITARVEGNYGVYDIDIWFDEHGIDADCDCPYDGYGCKHIVAVLLKFLYEFKDNYIHEHTQKRKKKDSNSLNITLDIITEQTSKQAVLDAFDIIEEKKIKIKSLDNTKIIAEIDERPTQPAYMRPGRNKDKITVEIKRFYSLHGFGTECDCSRSYQNAKCKHATAVLLALFLQKNKKQLTEVKKEFISKIRSERFMNFVHELDSISLEKPKHARNYEFYFDISKKSSPYDNKFSISIKKRCILKSGKLGVPSNVKEKLLREYYDTIPNNRKMVFESFMYVLEYDDKWGWNSKNLIKTEFNKNIDSKLLGELKDLYGEDPHAFANSVFPPKKSGIEIDITKNKKQKKFSLRLMVNAGERKFHLRKEDINFLGVDPLWVCAFDKEHRCFIISELDCQQSTIVRTLAKFSDAELELAQLKDFIEKYYLKLSNLGRVNLPKNYDVEEQSFKPVPRLFLRDYGNSFSVELRFLYNKEEVSYANKHDIVFKNDEDKIIKIQREWQKENEHFSNLLDNHTSERDNFFVPSIDPYLWLVDVANNLVSQGYEIYGKSELLNNRVSTDEPKLELMVSSGIDWFDLKGDVSFGKEKIPFDKIISSINNHERFIKLSDGTRGAIPKKWLKKLSGTVGLLQHTEKNGDMRASRSQIALVESLLDISDRSKIDKKFKKIKEKFSRFREIRKVPLPKKLKGELRDYQKAGYYWLHFLKDFSFGGCLADEMGLGKTVQLLSLLLHEKERGIKTPSMTVVPTSLVFNWVNEVKKFTPSLKVYIHHGSNRAKRSSSIWNKKPDLIITTYGTLRNDIDIFKNKIFNYIVLDESQHIKNPISKIAKNVYELRSKHRLSLTGTPIENNSLDLWSQFAFLNPGLLGNMDYFKKTFARSIERKKDKDKTNALKNMINPFLLMRKKDRVAKDLPEKQISILYCEMSTKQKDVYESWKSKIRSEIKTAMEEDGFMKSRFKVLQGLMKLRQICNHPILIDESFTGNSGKFDMLIEQIEEVIAEGHKVLVFSSFVKMLRVFRDEFEKKNIGFSYLDGSTRKRKEVVEQFQTDSNIKAFLISLKAGGLGLNLTEADYVFIVDPWWNPAAEMQAIDRTHRIGQKKNIFVYKAITKDTIEEKILELQESKLNLVKNVIEVDDSLFKKLNKNDIEKLFA
ncbi:MAG: DEAD/DEAH box helicase [Candidatus Altiarchaeales archaeon]|nr:DEAD/DEAH box helicase [Candidatus Altiarchaeales archaeon]